MSGGKKGRKEGRKEDDNWMKEGRKGREGREEREGREGKESYCITIKGTLLSLNFHADHQNIVTYMGLSLILVHPSHHPFLFLYHPPSPSSLLSFFTSLPPSLSSS